VLGLDDKIFIVILSIGVIGLFRIVFWLHKIYWRVRQIAKLLVHFRDEEKKK